MTTGFGRKELPSRQTDIGSILVGNALAASNHTKLAHLRLDRRSLINSSDHLERASSGCRDRPKKQLQKLLLGSPVTINPKCRNCKCWRPAKSGKFTSPLQRARLVLAARWFRTCRANRPRSPREDREHLRSCPDDRNVHDRPQSRRPGYPAARTG